MTYKEIQEKYKSLYNKTVKTCWIADVKRQLGFNVRVAYNRKSEDIKNKCPKDKIENLKNLIK